MVVVVVEEDWGAGSHCWGVGEDWRRDRRVVVGWSLLLLERRNRGDNDGRNDVLSVNDDLFMALVLGVVSFLGVSRP